ncbi:MAG: tagaturonate reductase [Ginsengibacter sp.]
MNLSKRNLKDIDSSHVIVPDGQVFDLPEKVLQFGTGMLLRGLPEYFIDKANRMGIFNGRIVVVKSTSQNDTVDFDTQDGLYTLCVRGVLNGKNIEENIINSSISRVLKASEEWPQVLQCAHNESLQVIISNTTEAGIKLMKEDDIYGNPPTSFPGKLLAFLLKRFDVFKGAEDSGLVIVPTELLPGNGKILKSIVLELAQLKGLDNAFIEWLNSCNYFCNSLVDRIVTGTPEEKIKKEIEDRLGYKDNLLIVCEVYKLWAIEGNEQVKKILLFAEADEGIKIKPDIDLYRELKLRLLNGTHTLSCGIAFLAGIATVKDGMNDEAMSAYICTLMKQELAPSVPYEIDDETINSFIDAVLDRFRNPHILHHWKNITLNYTQKMNIRCIPLLINYLKNENEVPELFALGFAAYLRFMKVEFRKGNEFYGELDGVQYLLQDEMAEKFLNFWKDSPLDTVVKNIMNDSSLWGGQLSGLTHFQQSVTEKLFMLMKNGMKSELKKVISKKNERDEL